MLTVRLFGKFHIECDQQTRWEIPGGKAQELLCYLMLHRHQLHPREGLAVLLWPDREAAKSKKSLRQVLWQLQLALSPAFKDRGDQALSINAECIFMDGDGSLRVDVDLFEKAYQQVHDLDGQRMDPAGVKAARLAVELYQGDLLEGCYQDWCLLERERLQNCYLFLLDKLICHCRAEQDYRRGIDYGERVLRLDRAHERTHQHLMRLHYESGDRTAALRQYARCKAALHEELGVEPSWQTKKLLDELRVEQPKAGAKSLEALSVGPSPRVVHHLQHLLKFINQVEIEVQKEIQSAKQVAQAHDRPPMSDGAGSVRQGAPSQPSTTSRRNSA